MYQSDFIFDIKTTPELSIVETSKLKVKQSACRATNEVEPSESQIQIIFNLDDETPAADDKWCNDSVDKIRSYLLKKTLAIFSDGRASSSSKAEAFEWLMSEELMPFSFRVCCGIEDLDPDLIRELTLRVIRNENKGQ